MREEEQEQSTDAGVVQGAPREENVSIHVHEGRVRDNELHLGGDRKSPQGLQEIIEFFSVRFHGLGHQEHSGGHYVNLIIILFREDYVLLKMGKLGAFRKEFLNMSVKFFLGKPVDTLSFEGNLSSSQTRIFATNPLVYSSTSSWTLVFQYSIDSYM